MLFAVLRAELMQPHRIDLIDSPGHVDFSSEVHVGLTCNSTCVGELCFFSSHECFLPGVDGGPNV